MPRLLHLCLIAFGGMALLSMSACTPEPEPDQITPFTWEGAQGFEIPTLTPLENGNIVVRFKKTGCSVLFDHNGSLIEQDKICDGVELERARKAVTDYIVRRDAGNLND